MRQRLFGGLMMLVAVTGRGEDAAYRVCLERSGGATAVVLACMDAALQRKLARLNRLYLETMRRLAPERRPAFAATQRRWRAYRDTWCAFLHPDRSGSGGREDEMQCLLDQMTRRIGDLERMP